MGYVGQEQAVHVLIDGLKKLEYRGYDSSGIAVQNENGLEVERAKGKIRELEKRINEKKDGVQGTVGIGHTRWATHGKPSDENAHPHRSGSVVVVHNGIIENYIELREKLRSLGLECVSQTDTETIPLLIESYLNEGKSFKDSVISTIAELKGTFSLAILCSKEPGKIIAAKNASPLILGIGEGENFVASDIPALLSHTRNVIILDDGEMAVLEKNSFEVMDLNGKVIKRKPKKITWSRVVAEKEGYKHFMLKEIHEQPRSLTDILRGRVNEVHPEIILDDIDLGKEHAKNIDRVVMVACGTSWHAALVGKFWIEELARIPTEVDYASEYRYRNPVVDQKVLFVPISQSGETADTLAAMETAKQAGARILSICNVIDSSIARKSDDVFYTHAGPEIGVASTKAFTTQLAGLLMLALHLGKLKGAVSDESFSSGLHALLQLPSLVEATIHSSQVAEAIAMDYSHVRDFLYLGRGSSYPIALEGALKLKEISYIHAEGYAGGEMKHGPIALIDENLPIVALMSGGASYAKILSNVQEAKARGGKILGVITKGDEKAKEVCDNCIEIPECDDLIRPILEVIPLQLLAYYIADHLGTDGDQPRNLAKSVTVE